MNIEGVRGKRKEETLAIKEAHGSICGVWGGDTKSVVIQKLGQQLMTALWSLHRTLHFLAEMAPNFEVAIEAGKEV